MPLWWLLIISTVAAQPIIDWLDIDQDPLYNWVYPNEYKYKVLRTYKYVAYNELSNEIAKNDLTWTSFCPGVIQYGLEHGILQYNLPFIPDDNTGLIPYDNMGTCDPHSCKSHPVSMFRLVQFFVGHGSFPRNEIWGSVYHVTNNIQGMCILYEMGDAGARKCKDGEYASDYIQLNPAGHVLNAVKCLPCQPGTWATCVHNKPCEWEIPSTDDMGFTKPSDMYDPMNGLAPVWACWPCSAAGGYKYHYWKDTTGLSSIIKANPSSDTLSWYCPGNVNADGVPRMCDKGDLIISNRNHTYCVCAAGTYKAGVTCSACPAGHMCPAGELIECPDDFYQDKTGQTECYRCTNIGSFCYSGQLLRKCAGRFKSQPLTCVPCSMCNKRYVNEKTQGKVDCYES